MRKQLSIIIAIILILLVALFAVANVENVPVNFGFAQASWPLIMVILGSLFIGALVTVLVSTSTTFKTRKQLKTYEKDITEADQSKEEELSHLRSEYEEKLEQKEARLREQEAKISSLEKELVDRMTHTSSSDENIPGKI